MSLNVIALISGGKDSFFSLLHCMAHGHNVVALANLHPETIDAKDDEDEEDLNSFMYQTVGHQVLPLYAAATGLPLYRQPILGHAVQSGREYHHGSEEGDETESMTRLLRRVMADHPEANAVCAGALLSTYQRTRVESVAVRLGLVSLAYLWKYPILPASISSYISSAGASMSTITDYLDDLTAAGFDARIIKVASGGLDDSLLWTNVATAAGRARLQRALQRLGLADDGPGSMLGEGGEYETLVVDGPRALFRDGSLSVDDADKRVVHEGGGTSWLRIKTATVVPNEKTEGVDDRRVEVRQPRMLDARFSAVLELLKEASADTTEPLAASLSLTDETPFTLTSTQPSAVTTWRVVPELSSTSSSPSIADATQSVVDQVRQRLQYLPNNLSPTHSVVRTLVVLRRMADFPAFNAVYGTLFTGAPNPPSRVTIACGEELPEGVDVAVFLSVLDDTTKTNAAHRQGLHVQSRSYWAPANIGPYSQAVSVLAHGDGNNSSSGPRVVSIAGQIPLVPATMELSDQVVEAREGGENVQPSSSPASFSFHATLALQHLWRIGIDLDVQWWGSTVAYVPRQTDEAALPSLSTSALLAAQAWRTAHEWRPKSEYDEEDDDEEDSDGPDLWDRKFDARFAMYGAIGGGDENTPQLPDWRVLDNSSPAKSGSAVPPVFLAEVQELPRSAPVEWHAQAGFSHVSTGGNSSIQVRAWTGTDNSSNKTWTYQTILKTAPPRDDNYDDITDSDDDTKDSRPAPPPRSSRVVIQTTTAWAYPADTKATVTLSDAALAQNVDMVYADMHVCRVPDTFVGTTPVVPCASLWNGRGERLAAVVVQTIHGEV
ncbi:hypothetical protein Sste5346_008406 [Sporothrix stenoceras]|uniref:Diphthine--ammonia ligase n=1 Tax=Sporothrix stenoceras TaxID=5173 RepID=A0ABR3YQ69_9PEZI